MLECNGSQYININVMLNVNNDIYTGTTHVGQFLNSLRYFFFHLRTSFENVSLIQ